jgi:hypothetical protein
LTAGLSTVLASRHRRLLVHDLGRVLADLACAIADGTGEVMRPAVRVHRETVLRSFYGFHLDAGSGPMVNPFPLDRSGRRLAAAATS